MRTQERKAHEELARVAARRRLDERDIYRAIQRAVEAGLSQRQISDTIQSLSQATIQRMIQRIAATPELLRETPAEIIDQRAAGFIDTDAMMDTLLHWKYRFGAVPRIDDVATDAYMKGDWDEIESAYYRDLLSDDEFAKLSKHQLEKIDQAVRIR